VRSSAGVIFKDLILYSNPLTSSETNYMLFCCFLDVIIENMKAKINLKDWQKLLVPEFIINAIFDVWRLNLQTSPNVS
jgi:hypothetical protein